MNHRLLHRLGVVVGSFMVFSNAVRVSFIAGVRDLMERTSNTACLVRAKGFYFGEFKKYSMRAIDAKILDELEMHYGDKDCFYPLRDWFGTAEVHWTNLERLFMVADYAEKHNPSVAEKIAAYNKRIVDLFHQTKEYATVWDSKHKEKHKLSTEDYVEATDESWDALDRWTVTQEKLRHAILDFVKLLYSVVSES